MNIIEDKIEIYTILSSFINERRDALDLLELFIDNALQNNDYNFSSGLIGAGWLLSYLHQQEIIQDDIDELLYDFDDNFYKIAIKIIVEEKSSLAELLNIINYYQQRIQNKSNSYNYHRRFPLFETIKLLSEKLVSKLTSEELSIHDKIICLLKLSYLSRTCVNEKEIEKVYYEYTEKFISQYKLLKTLTAEDEFNISILLLASIQFEHPVWINELRNIHNEFDLDSNAKCLMMNSFNQKIGDSKENKIQKNDLQDCKDENILYLIISNVKRVDLTKKITRVAPL